MKRITPKMIQKGGKAYCRVCGGEGDARTPAVWRHDNRNYCEAHKPAYTPEPEEQSEADYDIERRYGI